MNKKMINLTIPDFGHGARQVHQRIFKIIKNHPEMIYQNTKIYTVYDCPNNCIWSGSVTNGMGITRTELKDIFAFYNDELKIPVSLVFNNPQIKEEKHCWDSYGNMIAEVGHNGKNQIIVSSSILEDYLRKTYPNYLYNRSIIADTIKENKDNFDLYDKYNKIILKHTYNSNFNFLKQIPEEKRGQIELLCANSCPSDCPYDSKHYQLLGIKQLNYEQLDLQEFCQNSCKTTSFLENYYINKDKNTITRFDIDTLYYPMGFLHYKLFGRRRPIQICSELVKYLIKPEYKEDVFNFLISVYINKEVI